MTLKEVADKLGLKGHSTYSNWEYGFREPSIDDLQALSTIFEVSIDYLTGKTDQREPGADNQKTDVSKTSNIGITPEAYEYAKLISSLDMETLELAQQISQLPTEKINMIRELVELYKIKNGQS